jgi:hypothetical protein
MSFPTRRCVPLVLLTSLALLLASGHAQAQCRGGQQQNRSQRPMVQQQPTGQQQAVLQAALLQQQQLMQQQLMRQQQQNVLQAALPQQPQQVVLQGALPQQAPAQPAVAPQLRVVPMPVDRPSVPPPANREDAANRQLQLAQDLVADATTAQVTGEWDRANRMRDRAGDRLRQIVGQFPGTRAADQAQQVLARLGG